MLSLFDLVKYIDSNYFESAKQIDSNPSAMSDFFNTTNHAYSYNTILEQLLYCLYKDNKLSELNSDEKKDSNEILVYEGSYDVK